MKIFARSLVLILALVALVFFPHMSKAESIKINETENSGGTSGLHLPRFAALRSGEVNMRTGPGTRYPIEWVLTRKGLPVEITAEYEVWRRIRDPEGSEGWVHKSALSGKRSAIVTGSERELRSQDSDASEPLAHLTQGVVGQLISCSPEWCKLKFDGIKGYLRKTEFWGAYPSEILN